MINNRSLIFTRYVKNKMVWDILAIVPILAEAITTYPFNPWIRILHIVKMYCVREDIMVRIYTPIAPDIHVSSLHGYVL